MNSDFDIDKPSSSIKISYNSKNLNILDHNSKDKGKHVSQIFTLIGIYIICLLICFTLFKLYPDVRLLFIDIINEGGTFGLTTIIICIGAGTILNMIGVPVSFYEMLMGLLWKRFDYGIFIGTSFRMLAILCGYIISKKYLIGAMTLYLKEFKYFKGICYLAKTKPASTILMLRFCYIPSVIKIYAPPIFGFSLLYCLAGGLCSSLFFCSINVSIGITAVSLTSIGNEEQESFMVRILPIMVMILGIILQIVLFFYTQTVMKEFENLASNDQKSNNGCVSSAKENVSALQNFWTSLASKKDKILSWKVKRPEFMIDNEDDNKSERSEDTTRIEDREIDAADFLINIL